MLFKQMIYTLGVVSSLLIALPALAVDSGSTGSDGDFAPTADVAISLPANGILNYNTINIPTGVTVRFVRNSANTPVYLLVKGDAVIEGSIDISGVVGGAFSVAYPPGGFDGGTAQATGLNGGNGKGPGGGGGSSQGTYGGAGAGYALFGTTSNSTFAVTGSQYGSIALQPLLGGSGGGTGKVDSGVGRVYGFAGGSGAGALLLAVSGTLTLNGSILAVGGDGESETAGIHNGSMGGAGSGGGVRIVASDFTGAGSIDISGGKGGTSKKNPSNTTFKGGNGSPGRVRIEADRISFTGQTIPNAATIPIAAQPIFLANLPTIRIASIGGQTVPANPTGSSDVVFPANVTNPVTVEFEVTGVPANSTVLLTLTPERGTIKKVTSTALTGTDTLTASAEVTLPSGASVMLASVAFSASAAQAQGLSRYTNGELVDSIELASSMDGGSQVVLITKSGRSVTLDPTTVNAR